MLTYIYPKSVSHVNTGVLGQFLEVLQSARNDTEVIN